MFLFHYLYVDSVTHTSKSRDFELQLELSRLGARRRPLALPLTAFHHLQTLPMRSLFTGEQRCFFEVRQRQAKSSTSSSQSSSYVHCPRCRPTASTLLLWPQLMYLSYTLRQGAFSLAQIAPNMQALSFALAAATSIFTTIDRVPVIDSSSPEGLKPESVEGFIEVKDLDFIYPSRPAVQVLYKFNAVFPRGKMTAVSRR
jgi:ABC-type multidrug transport system fused ATPase/permease subunit